MRSEVDEAFIDGVHEALHQVNKYMEEGNFPIRFVDAGYNTVCQVGHDSKEYQLYKKVVEGK